MATNTLPIEVAVPENDTERDALIQQVDYMVSTCLNTWRVYIHNRDTGSVELPSGLAQVIAVYMAQIETYEARKQAEAV